MSESTEKLFIVGGYQTKEVKWIIHKNSLFCSWNPDRRISLSTLFLQVRFFQLFSILPYSFIKASFETSALLSTDFLPFSFTTVFFPFIKNPESRISFWQISVPTQIFLNPRDLYETCSCFREWNFSSVDAITTHDLFRHSFPHPFPNPYPRNFSSSILLTSWFLMIIAAVIYAFLVQVRQFTLLWCVFCNRKDRFSQPYQVRLMWNLLRPRGKYWEQCTCPVLRILLFVYFS